MYMNRQKTKALLVTGKRLQKRIVQDSGKLEVKISPVLFCSVLDLSGPVTSARRVACNTAIFFRVVAFPLHNWRSIPVSEVFGLLLTSCILNSCLSLHPGVYMDAGDLMLGLGEVETLLVTSCYRTKLSSYTDF